MGTMTFSKDNRPLVRDKSSDVPAQPMSQEDADILLGAAYNKMLLRRSISEDGLSVILISDYFLSGGRTFRVTEFFDI